MPNVQTILIDDHGNVHHSEGDIDTAMKTFTKAQYTKSTAPSIQEKNTEISLNLDSVPVTFEKASVTLRSVHPNGFDNSLNFEGAKVENLGGKSVRIVTQSGHTVHLNIEQFVASLLKAADLPAIG